MTKSRGPAANRAKSKGFASKKDSPESPPTRAQTPLEQLTTAKQLFKLNQKKEAEKIYREILNQGDRNLECYYFLALICGQSERFKEAITLLNNAIEISPLTPGVNHNLGMAYHGDKNYKKAVEHFKKELEINPNKKETLVNLGNSLRRLNLDHEAIQYYLEALPGHPKPAEIHYNIGIAETHRGNRTEAIQRYKKALDLEPRHKNALQNLGVQYEVSSDYELAKETLQYLLSLDPQNCSATFVLSKAYLESGHLDEATTLAGQALTLNPEDAVLKMYTAPVFDYVCNFDKAPGTNLNLIAEEILQSDEPNLDALDMYPFFSLHHNSTLEDHISHAEIIKEIGKKHRDEDCKESVLDSPQRNQYDASVKTNSHRRIKVGLVSGDFYDHVVPRFLLPFLRQIDQSKLELHFYSNREKQDAVTQQFKDISRNFHSIHGIESVQAKALIESHQIDFLIDLSGHSRGNRLDIFRLRAAPIQASWLGYPASTGLKTMDYIFIDRFLVSEQLNKLCTEIPLPLNGPFLSFDKLPDAEINPTAPCRTNGYVTFGTLNHPRKYSRTMLETWAEVLKIVPDSRLLIARSELRSEQLRENIYKLFCKNGVETDRIQLQGLNKKNYLDSYNKIDISLDTFPYTGTTTTIDALWMGVPVVTHTGTSIHQRASASLVQHINMDHWIAHSQKEYIDIASSLANSGGTLTELRGSLRGKLRQSSLCDVKNFAQDFHTTIQELLIKH
jgi:protein O-GlcNAc transferase